MDIKDWKRKLLAERKRLFPDLVQYTHPVRKPSHPIVGRDALVDDILSDFERVELSNVLLVGAAGSGKTSIVQRCAQVDAGRDYIEVDLARMIGDLAQTEQMAARVKSLFDQTMRYPKWIQQQYAKAGVEREAREIVLFIDEFHQIVQLSAAAVEALKPMLADSASRGIRVICATTYIEFDKYVAGNQPLVERLHRFNLPETNEEETLSVLRAALSSYGYSDDFVDDSLLKLIYTYTERYIPANAQPRKSLLVLDAMIGWHRHKKRPFDRQLLADVLYRTEGVEVMRTYDATAIAKTIREHVFAQDLAAQVIENRLQLATAGLNDPDKPRATLFFAGPTGVGKTQTAKTLSDILFGNHDRSFVRFNMTDYSAPEDATSFRYELTRRVWQQPSCVLLLDEIEKASSDVIKLLYPVLDDAYLIDKYNREVSFKDCIIILTSNAGEDIFRDFAARGIDIKTPQGLREYRKLIQDGLSAVQDGSNLPTAFIGRLDAIVPFNGLGTDTLKRITRRQLTEIGNELEVKHGVHIDFDMEMLETYIVDECYDTDTVSGGARGLLSLIEDEVTSPVAAFVNANPTVKNMGVIVEGEMRVADKHLLHGNAYVVVRPGRFRFN